MPGITARIYQTLFRASDEALNMREFVYYIASAREVFLAVNSPGFYRVDIAASKGLVEY